LKQAHDTFKLTASVSYVTDSQASQAICPVGPQDTRSEKIKILTYLTAHQ